MLKLVSTDKRDEKEDKATPQVIELAEYVMKNAKSGRYTGLMMIAITDEDTYEPILCGSVFDDDVRAQGMANMLKRIFEDRISMKFIDME